MVRKFILGVTVSTAIVMAGASAAFANSTGSTGQPNQSCEEHPSTPGNAATARALSRHATKFANRHAAQSQRCHVVES